MRSKLLGYAVSAATAGALSMTAAAGTVTSDGEDIVINTKGGFEAKTASGDFSFKIGGRVQLQYDNYQDAMNLVDGDGDTGSDLFFRRARIYLKGDVYENWAYKIQFNLVEDGDGGGTAEDLYIRWKRYQWATMTFGKHKEPFSLQELTSSKWVTTVERAQNVDFFAEGRNIGISIGGASNFWGYQIGAYNPTSNLKDEEGQQLIAFTGRAHLSPINSDRALLHFGLAATSRDLEEGGFDGGSGRQGINKGDKLRINLLDDAKKRTGYNLELAGKVGPVHGQIEYNQRKTTLEGDNPDADGQGWYGQVGWFITGESRAYKKGKWDKVKPNNRGIGAWEIFGRVEQLDWDDDGFTAATRNKGSIYTAGVNWYPNDILRISANYVQSNWDEALASDGSTLVRADSLEDSPLSEDSGRGFAVRMQAAF